MATMKDDSAEYTEQSAAGSSRLTVPINVPNLLQTGKVAFEVMERDVGYFEDDNDEEARFDSEDEAVERPEGCGIQRGGVKNDFAYLRDVSLAPFVTPPEGTVVHDLRNDGAVKKIVIQDGQGLLVPDACKVFVHYVFATAAGTVFDSTLSTERRRPAGIDLRGADVLPGIHLALRSMRMFEAAKFQIRYDEAFGELGCPPRIPPMTDIVCAIQVLSIVDAEKLKTIKFMSADERNALPFPEILNHANEKKRQGNSLYSSNKSFGRAVRVYLEGINILEDYPVIVEEDNDQRQATLFALFNNLAQCYLKLDKWPQACVACQKGLLCLKEGDPSASKIFYRFAIAKRNLGHPTHALDLINKALQRDPNNKSIRLEKNTILERIKEEKDLSKRLMARMGGAFSGQSKTEPKKTVRFCEGAEDQNDGQSGGEKVEESAEGNVEQEDTAEAFDRLNLSK